MEQPYAVIKLAFVVNNSWICF